MSNLIYFAHPITHYGTELEKLMLNAIETKFPESEIFNPNAEWLQRVYAARKAAKMESGDCFRIFTEIAEVCDSVVGNTFLNRTLGCGIFGEMVKASEAGKEIHLIECSEQIVPRGMIKVEWHEPGTASLVDQYVQVLNLEQTREKVHTLKEQ